MKSDEKENDLRLAILLVSGLLPQNMTWFSSVSEKVFNRIVGNTLVNMITASGTSTVTTDVVEFLLSGTYAVSTSLIIFHCSATVTYVGNVKSITFFAKSWHNELEFDDIIIFNNTPKLDGNFLTYHGLMMKPGNREKIVVDMDVIASNSGIYINSPPYEISIISI